MKIKIFLKRFISVVVGVSLVASVTFVAAVAASSFDDILGLSDEEALDVVRSGILGAHGITGEDLTMEYYTNYYTYITNDWWGLAAGSGGIYSSDGSFNTNYLDACEQQIGMFFAGNGIPFDWSGFLIYAKARRAKELAGETFSDDDYASSNKLEPIHISGEMLKAATADYNSRYMPMANEDQYFYHFHGDNTSSYDNSKWDFTPYCPVYIFEKQWGNKSWTDFYFIPVISDDDKTTFYGQQYGHIYAKKVDGTTTMYFDLINMSDDSIAKSFSFVYDATTYKWIGLQFNGSLYNIYGFTSSYNYLSGKLVVGQYAEYGPFVQSTNMLSWDGSSTIGLNFLLTDPTFSPKTNKNDDWGYILSNKPFELFANQTKIDFDRVPNNYIITINGDTIYDYSITNPDTGDTTDIKDYIDHDYDIPDLPDIKDPDDNSGTSGNVEVSGKIDVSGKVDVDVNVNVNSGSNGDSGSNGNAGDYIDPGTVDTNLDNYLEQVPELSKGFVDYLKDFFAWLPDEIYGLIILGLVVVVWCRLAGR